MPASALAALGLAVFWSPSPVIGVHADSSNSASATEAEVRLARFAT